MYLDRHRSADMSDFVLNVARNEPGYVGRVFSTYIDAFEDVKVFRLEDGIEKALAFCGISEKPRMKNKGRFAQRLNSFARSRICASEAEIIGRFWA